MAKFVNQHKQLLVRARSETPDTQKKKLAAKVSGRKSKSVRGTGQFLKRRLSRTVK